MSLRPKRPSRGPGNPLPVRRRRATGVSDGPIARLLEAYARNLLVATPLATSLDSDGDPVFMQSELLAGHLGTWADARPGGKTTAVKDLKTFIAEAGDRPSRVGLAPGGLGVNIRALGTALRLSRTDRAVLQLKVAMLLSPRLERALDLLGPLTLGGTASTLAAVLGEPRSRVLEALSGASALVRSGLLVVAPGTLPVEQKLTIHRKLTDLLTGPRLHRKRFADAWLPLAPPPTLEPSDFAHLGRAVERLEALLGESVRRRERGVNVLLHGPTGCGKTELARLVARSLGVELRMAGAVDDDGLAPNFWERLSSIHTADRLLAGTPSLLLFDEMQDIFDSSGSGPLASLRSSKVWFTALLERNEVPCIWITNDAGSMDPAVLRRFVMAIELPGLDAERRKAVWWRQAGCSLSEEGASALARRFEVNPAAIAGAVRATRLAGRGQFDEAVAADILAENVAAQTGTRPGPPAPAAIAYEPGLLRASVDLDVLAERLLRQGAAASATICLHGPPGTGKSEWVRQLADRMGRRLVERRVSDIESKWVGESEKAVARAFEEAERDRAILLFDEADSFLAERSRARARWEVTLTNEFLQRLEAARGIVACTTNTFEALDPAVMRRFSVKVELGYMTPASAARLFQRAFGARLGGLDQAAVARVTRRAQEIGPLAPGDFAAVARRLPLLGEDMTEGGLLRELEAEVKASRRGRGRAAGFLRAGAQG